MGDCWNNYQASKNNVIKTVTFHITDLTPTLPLYVQRSYTKKKKLMKYILKKADMFLDYKKSRDLKLFIKQYQYETFYKHYFNILLNL